MTDVVVMVLVGFGLMLFGALIPHTCVSVQL